MAADGAAAPPASRRAGGAGVLDHLEVNPATHSALLPRGIGDGVTRRREGSARPYPEA